MFTTATICVFLFFPSLAWSAAVTNSSGDVSSQSSSNTRIVGGTIVTDRTLFPYQVSLRYNSGHSCGASLIDNQTLLTAAHCVYDSSTNKVLKASSIKAVLGDLNLTTSATTVTKNVKYIFVHESYNPANLKNDIAVLRIDVIDTFNSYINTVALPTSATADGTPCTVSGWGSTYEGGSLSNQLRSVNVPKFSTASCNVYYENTILSGMICAGNWSGMYDACQGDSGGPLVCNKVLTGIVSWGYGCARPLFPGVYTDVSSYLSWIKIQQARSSIGIMSINLYLLILSCISICYFM